MTLKCHDATCSYAHNPAGIIQTSDGNTLLNMHPLHLSSTVVVLKETHYLRHIIENEKEGGERNLISTQLNFVLGS